MFLAGITAKKSAHSIEVRRARQAIFPKNSSFFSLLPGNYLNPNNLPYRCLTYSQKNGRI